MLKRIKNIINEFKSSLDNPSSLESVFPKVSKIYYLDTDAQTDFSYVRVSIDEFEVVESLGHDFEPIISSSEMLMTVQQSLGDGSYNLKIQKISKDSYNLVLEEID